MWHVFFHLSMPFNMLFLLSTVPFSLFSAWENSTILQNILKIQVFELACSFEFPRHFPQASIKALLTQFYNNWLWCMPLPWIQGTFLPVSLVFLLLSTSLARKRHGIHLLNNIFMHLPKDFNISYINLSGQMSRGIEARK